LIGLSVHRNVTPEPTAIQVAERESGRWRGLGSIEQENSVCVVSGVVRLNSLDEVKDYLKNLLDDYRKQYDRFANMLGTMYRDLGEGGVGNASAGWTEIGALQFNSSDLDKGRMDLALQLVADMKPRLAKTERVLEEFHLLEEKGLAKNSSFLLHLRNGSPERLVAYQAPPATEKFDFSDEFLTV
jgi:hypothetical protein